MQRISPRSNLALKSGARPWAGGLMACPRGCCRDVWRELYRHVGSVLRARISKTLRRPFDLYAHAIGRFTNECNRLYGVMNRRLADRDFLAGRNSMADMACVGLASRWAATGTRHRRVSGTSSAGSTGRSGGRRCPAACIRMDDVATRATLFRQRARQSATEE